MEYLIFLIYFIILKELPIVTAYADDVSMDLKWPVKLEDMVTFTVNKDFNEKSVLVFELNVTEKIRKFLKISKPQYVDILTDYYTIKKGIRKNGLSSFTFKMQFLRKSQGALLTFRWYPSGVLESNEDALNTDRNVIYSSNIQLWVKWKINMAIQILDSDTATEERVYQQEEKYFQHGKTAKITCSAFDGLPLSRVYVNGISSKRFRNPAYDVKLNTWIGYVTLTVHDHNTNVSCHVGGTSDIMSLQIKVNHPPTTFVLEPEYNGYVKNGSKIKCTPFDGYPLPLIQWDFVSVKNHSNPKSLYQINHDELTISPDVVLGTQMEFNCTAFYTNPLSSDTIKFQKTYRFEVGERSNDIAMVTDGNRRFEKLNKAAIGAAVAGIVIMVIAVSIVIMLCRSKPKPTNASAHRQEGSPKYSGSLLAGSKSTLHNQVKSQNGANSAFISNDTKVSSDQNEFNYDDMPRGRRPIKVVDEPVVYSTIIGTMQPKIRPSLDLGPIDRV